MDGKQKKEIEEILGGIECPTDFKCYKTELKELCKTQDFGLESFLVCLEDNENCKYSHSVGSRYFCQCPLHNYIV